MKNIRNIFLVMQLLAITVGLVSYHSDDFLIGAYSTCVSYGTNAANANSIATMANEAGFNALVGRATYSHLNSEPENMFSIFNNNSLDAIFEDWIFYPNTNPELEKYGYSALSSGINMRFEAEYASSEHVNPNDGNSDRFFYMSPINARVGSFADDTRYSNRNYWTVNDGTSGYAYKDITYRWLKPDDTAYRRVGREFRLLGENFTNGIHVFDINNLHIDFVFKVDELDSYLDTDTLAVFSFVKHNNDDNASSADYDSLYFYYGEPNPTREYSLTKGEYLKLPIVDRIVNLRAIEFTFDIGGDGSDADYSLMKQGVMKANGRHLGIDNLNPWMYWNGKGKLKLDYVDYKVR